MGLSAHKAYNSAWCCTSSKNPLRPLMYTSKPVSVYDFLERQDRKIFRKVSNAKGHPLLSIMPRFEPSSYNLRKETCFKPKINTMRFKNSFINCLIFKCELAM